MDNTQNSSYSPEKSGPAPSDLPGLKSWKATRSSSSIIDARRAAQALAASRMAAKVAVDKALSSTHSAAHGLLLLLEARENMARRSVEDRRISDTARNLLSHARDQGGSLEMALEDFRDFDPSLLGEMGERVLNRAQDLDGEGATSAPRRRYRSCLNPYRRGDY